MSKSKPKRKYKPKLATSNTDISNLIHSKCPSCLDYHDGKPCHTRRFFPKGIKVIVLH